MIWSKPILATLLAATCGLAGCRLGQQKDTAQAHYVLGAPWRAGQIWFYPAVEPSYDATGLAVVQPDLSPALRTADGESYSPDALTGAHQTLPLPAIVEVTDLETGRALQIRLNDRGPASAGRLLAVTPHVARLLGMSPQQPGRVRVRLDSARTRVLLADVKDAPPPEIVAAPLAAVSEQPLGPADSGVPRSRADLPLGGAALPTIEPEGAVRHVPVDPGRLWVEAGRFSARQIALDVARRLRARLSVDPGQALAFSVRLGPFAKVEEADAALDRAQLAGLTGARIIVQ